MSRRSLLLAAVITLGVAVSSATAQQPVVDCVSNRATIVGTAGDDSITGTDGRDVIHGLQGNDTIDGGEGDDLICAGDGDDTVDGNYGWDHVTGGPGNDRLDAGDQGPVGQPLVQSRYCGDCDSAIYADAPGAVVVDLVAETATGAAGRDTLVNFDSVVGSRYADRLSGGAYDDFLLGLGGADRLAGRGGQDALDPGGGNDAVDGGQGEDYVDYFGTPRPLRINLATQRAFGAGSDRLRGIEAAIGGDRDDTLIGDRRRNYLFGERGDDTIAGRGGDDDVHGGPGNDRLDGGAGFDAFQYYDFRRRIRINLTTRRAFGDGTDRLSSIEAAWGGDSADTLIGDHRRNALEGGDGNDRLEGRGGADRLFGGPGRDRLDGGAGRDRCEPGNGEPMLRCEAGLYRFLRALHARRSARSPRSG